MNLKRVILIGGSGFIGSFLANQLNKSDMQTVIPVRRISRTQPMYLLPNATVVEADIHDQAALIHLLTDADAVINLAGILHSRSGSPYGPDFEQVHVELVRKLVQACHITGVQRLIHISALGAAADGSSEYQRSKAAGEAVLHGSDKMLAWTILRPSVVFGPGDRFLNLFAQLQKCLPVIPLAGAASRLQPVYVGDVARVIQDCLARNKSIGQTYELAGPTIYTLRQLVRYAGELIGKPRPIFALPDGLARLQAAIMELMPEPLMTRDNLRSLQTDNVAHEESLPFGLTPTPLETVAPAYLGNKTIRNRYYLLRSRTRHLYD